MNPYRPHIPFRRTRSKYHAQPVIIDNHKFDSKAEGAYYILLKGQGVDFKMQEKFEILPAFKFAGKRYAARAYTPDFCIYESGNLIKAIDVKGGKATLTTDARLRMVMWVKRYQIPLYVARYDYRTGLFEETRA